MAKKSGNQKISLNQELLTSIEQLNEEKVASFLEKGADPDMRNKKGDTLLNIALSSETISPKIVELLVENGAHLNYVSSDRVTPLMCAVYNIHVPTETVSYLLQAGASVYSRDTYGQTPLLYATGREDIALVDLLLTYGANVNETDADGNTLLFEAVRQGYENLFSYLVDQGADLTVRDYQGATLLMSAIENKQEKMAHLLLQFPEIDILATRVDGLTALDMVHDLLNETENSSEWKELSETLDSKVSERLSFFDELSEGDSNEDDWADWDEETEEESFVEVKDPIGDGFDDVDFEEEMVLTPSSDNHLSEEDIPFVLEEDEEVQGFDDDAPTYQEVIEQESGFAQEDYALSDDVEDEDFVDQENMNLVLSAHDEYVKATGLGLCIKLKQAGLEPILQMTGRDRNRMALMGDALAAAAFGIDSMLALTGDHPVCAGGDCKDAKPVYDLDSVGILRMLTEMEQTGCDCGGNVLSGNVKDLP